MGKVVQKFVHFGSKLWYWGQKKEKQTSPKYAVARFLFWSIPSLDWYIHYHESLFSNNIHVRKLQTPAFNFSWQCSWVEKKCFIKYLVRSKALSPCCMSTIAFSLLSVLPRRNTCTAGARILARPNSLNDKDNFSV